MSERDALIERMAKGLFDRFAPDHMFYTDDDPQYDRWRDMARVAVDISSPQSPATRSCDGTEEVKSSLQKVQTTMEPADSATNGERG